MGIKVSVPSKINTFVKNITKKYTNDKIFIDQQRCINSDKIIYSLKGSYGFNGKDDKNSEHCVIPIILKNQDKIYYWLSLSLIFRIKLGLHFLIGINLGIYEGENIYTESKKLLFRAEWECLEEYNVKHAQPHWHFSLPKKESTTQFIFEGAEVKDFRGVEKLNEISIKSNLSKFHFAMLADWNTNSICTKPLDNESQLKKWLNNCLLYIQEQLVYIS